MRKSNSEKIDPRKSRRGFSYPVAVLVVLMEFIKIRVKSAAGLVRPLSRERVFAALDASREAVASFSREYCASITLISKYRDRQFPAARRDKRDWFGKSHFRFDWSTSVSQILIFYLWNFRM